jgi:hypothetical protein
METVGSTEPGKPWYTSKTLILNGLVFLIAFVGWLYEASSAGTLPFRIDGEHVALVLTVLNFMLRYTTTEPIK